MGVRSAADLIASCHSTTNTFQHHQPTFGTIIKTCVIHVTTLKSPRNWAPYNKTLHLEWNFSPMDGKVNLILTRPQQPSVTTRQNKAMVRKTKKQKAKRILGPALFLQGYSHHRQGDKERFNSCQGITGGFPRGYFMGWHKPTPSVTCRWTCQAGLIRSETQRAIASLDNTTIALRVHNSRPKTEAAERHLNWILSLAGPWQWFTCNPRMGWELDSA